MILAYVTKMEYPLFTVMLLPLIFGAVFANSPEWFGVQIFNVFFSEIAFLSAYFVFVFFAYLHWALAGKN